MDANEIRFGEIVDWVEGNLDPDHARRLEKRLAAAAPNHRSDAGWLRALDQAKSQVILETAPDVTRHALRSRFRDFHASRERFAGLRICLATLQFDSRATPALAGIRSPGLLAEPQHLIYNTEVADIAVDVHRRGPGGRLDVMGQLFPNTGRSPSAFRVQLARGAESMGVRDTDDLGEFLFPDVLPGDYHMILSTGDLGILVTPVNLSF